MILEFIGLPRAGKTQNAEELKRSLDYLGYSVYLIPDQIKSVPPYIKEEIKKNRWAITKISNILAEIPDDYIVIGDRLGMAHLSSIKTLVKCDRIRREDIGDVEFAERMARDVISCESLFVFIDISVKVSLARNRESLIVQRTGKKRILCSEVISEMEKTYRELVSAFLPQERLLSVNGERPFREVQKEIFDGIISFIKRKDSQGGRNDCKDSIITISSQEGEHYYD